MKKICKKLILTKTTLLGIIQYYVKDKQSITIFILKNKNLIIKIKYNINNKEGVIVQVKNRGDEKLDFKELEEKNMINIIYQVQDKKIDEILKKTDENVKDKLKKINLEKIMEDSNCAKEFNKIEDNYNIIITEYNKEMYKQGFIDGVNLILNCLKD